MKLKWPLAFLFCLASAHAQMYRSVDARGNVTYSDQPPSSSVKLETKPLPAEDAEGMAMPYALSQAFKNHPVTLYTSGACAPCDEARTFLKQRGIPFYEKLVSSNEDVAFMKQQGGDGRLPLLTVGRTPYTGFEAGAWGIALTAAGYPATSQLPPGFMYPPPQQAVAPAPPPMPPAQPQPQGPSPAPAPEQGSAPPGFRF